MHKEIQVDKDHIFEWKFYDKNVQIVPILATVNIFDKSGSSVVSAASGTIDGAGTITYTFLEAANDTENPNFKIVLDYTFVTVERVVELFDIVKYPLINRVRDDDLFVYIKELRSNMKEKQSETTSIGTVSTFIDTNLSVDAREWIGGLGEMFISNEIVEFKVTAYNSTTNTVTFTPTQGSAIASGTKYIIRDSYQDQIDTAFEKHAHRDIRNKVGVSAGYIDSNIVENMTIGKALEIICNGESEEEGDKWDLRAANFAKMYTDELSKLQEPYDTDGDGDISDTEDRERPSTFSVDIIR